MYIIHQHVNSKFSRQHTKRQLAAAISPFMTPKQPTQPMIWMTCVMRYTTPLGKCPLLFSNSKIGSFQYPSNWLMKEGLRRQGQWLNITTQWCNHLNWDKILNHCYCYLKALGSGSVGVWIRNFPLNRPALIQLSLPEGKALKRFSFTL